MAAVNGVRKEGKNAKGPTKRGWPPVYFFLFWACHVGYIFCYHKKTKELYKNEKVVQRVHRSPARMV